MKKLRGQRRYFRKLKGHDDFEKLTALTFDKDSWFDFWHTHYDWQGLGDNSWKKRKPHLDTLFRNFDLYPERLESIKKPYQLFIQINDFDSSRDAVFIHTKNPGQDNFPYKPGLGHSSTLTNQQLIDYLDKKTKFEKIYGIAGNKGYCLLYKNGLGENLKYLASPNRGTK